MQIKMKVALVHGTHYRISFISSIVEDISETIADKFHISESRSIMKGCSASVQDFHQYSYKWDHVFMNQILFLLLKCVRLGQHIHSKNIIVLVSILIMLRYSLIAAI